VRSPNTETTFGFCFAHSVPMPATSGASQEDVDQALAGKFTKSYWEALFQGFGYKEMLVESAGETVVNGRTTYYAVAAYKRIRRAHRFKTVVHILPGRSYHLTCDAYLEAYAREQPAFEAFFDGFAPIDVMADK
jgi:hypothetical protein